MRRALFVMSAFLVLAAVPAADARDHTCVEVSGFVNTGPVLGDCEYLEGSQHNCVRFGSSQATVVVCWIRVMGYASTAT